MGGARRLCGPDGLQRGRSVSSEPAAVLTRPLLQPPLAKTNICVEAIQQR